MKQSKNTGPITKRYFKLLLLLGLILLATMVTNVASAQYTDIKRLGTTQAICKKPGVQTAAELQQYFRDNPETIRRILSDAQWPVNPQQLFDNVAAGDFSEQHIAPGTTFEWMGMRRNKQATALSKRRWAGDHAFSGFGLNIENECTSYHLVIPKICCNLALAKTSSIVRNPELSLKVVGRTIQVCSANRPKPSVFLTGPGNAKTVVSLDESGCGLSSELGPGTYTVVATSECGNTINSATIEKSTIEPEKEKLIPFIAGFVGTETLMRLETAWNKKMRDSSGTVGLRAGLKVPLGHGFQLVPVIGVVDRNGVNTGNIYPDRGLAVDLGVEKFLSKRFFVGAGIGVLDIDDSDFREASVFITVGGPMTLATEWFVEARGIDSDNPDGEDGFSDNRAFNAGIRWLFR